MGGQADGQGEETHLGDKDGRPLRCPASLPSRPETKICQLKTKALWVFIFSSGALIVGTGGQGQAISGHAYAKVDLSAAQSVQTDLP